MSTRLLASIFLMIMAGIGIASADQSLLPYAEKLTRRPKNQLTPFLFHRPLMFSGEISTESEFRGDFTLRDTARDDL